MNNAYGTYFDIDPNYFPVVNKELIDEGKVSWEDFYPHDTFVQLLQDTIKVMERKPKYCESLWVTGAYGTGKSHAVLTLKSLLETDAEETKNYFERYRLDMDWHRRLEGQKNHKKTIVVHRYGSSGINSDNKLIMYMQESIKEVLVRENVLHMGESTLKEAIIRKLEDSDFAAYINSLITGKYKHDFSPYNSVESVINALRNLSIDEADLIINKLFMLSDNEGITVFSLTITEFKKWIENVVDKNNIRLFFIWDEFTEFFSNNKNNLTGFQDIAEISERKPFHFVIVTHATSELFHEQSNDRKVLDRFVSPVQIEMPENTAFKLIGAALAIKDDSTIRMEWNKVCDDLSGYVKNSANVVAETTVNVTVDDLKRVLPIHPYTAYILKHLAERFQSNQRSMFEFIKGEATDYSDKSFTWYINNYGPNDDWRLLTCDMLWDYFYGDGRGELEDNLRNLLNAYKQYHQNLDIEEQKVLKTALLLQGISEKTAGVVEQFRSTKKNLELAYEGTYLGNGRVSQILERLVDKKVLYKRPFRNGEEFVVVKTIGDMESLIDIENELRETVKLRDIIDEYDIEDEICLEDALGLRYEVHYATVDNNEFRKIINIIDTSSYINKIPLIITFARNDAEAAVVSERINEVAQEIKQKVVLVDTSLCPLTNDRYDEIIKAMAKAKYWLGKDNDAAENSSREAEKKASQWTDALKYSELLVYIEGNRKRVSNGLIDLKSELKRYNDKVFPNNIDNISTLSSMFVDTSRRAGALQGILCKRPKSRNKSELKSVYRSARIDIELYDIWGVDKYWKMLPSHNISKIKIDLDKFIKSEFDRNARVSINDIWEFVEDKPYGFMKCNLSAILLGYLLKEYREDKYTWSNGSITEFMSPEKLADMVDMVTKDVRGSIQTQYILVMTDDEKKFLEASSLIFDVSIDRCTSTSNTKNEIINAIRKYSYPLWTLSLYVKDESLALADQIAEIVDAYCELANNTNSEKEEKEIAERIGFLCSKHNGLVDGIRGIMSSENLRKGMLLHIQNTKPELITLAKNVYNNSQYAHMLLNRLSGITEEISWLFHREHLDEKLDEVVQEYRFIDESNRFTQPVSSYQESINAWRNKLLLVRLPYYVFQDEYESISDLLKLFKEVYRNSNLSLAQIKSFVESLSENGELVTTMFESQRELFSKKFSNELFGLGDGDIHNVFQSMPPAFSLRKDEYKSQLLGKIAKYRKTLKKTELLELWKEKTNTLNPNDWSIKYNVPILYMFDSNIAKAKMVCDAVNNNRVLNDAEIDQAIDFIKTSEVFESINDLSIINKVFKKNILKKYAVLLSVEETKLQLRGRLGSNVYDWYGNTEIDKIIRSLAEGVYETREISKVVEKIDSMDPVSAKKYLKELVRKDLDVGIAIIED